MAATTSWLSELTGTKKSIIGMVHLPALPGTPLYDAAGGMQHIRDWVRRDLDALQNGGIDAVMFCNENDRPYRLDADAASVAAMADVVASVRDEVSVPFGVNVLWDPHATLAVAAATQAAFAREIFTGAFAGDFGLWVRTAGDTFRYRREIGAESCRLIFNINAEFAEQIAPRPLPDSRSRSSSPPCQTPSVFPAASPARRCKTNSVAEVAKAICRVRGPAAHQHGLSRQQRRRSTAVRRWRHRRLQPEAGWRDLERGRRGAGEGADDRRRGPRSSTGHASCGTFAGPTVRAPVSASGLTAACGRIRMQGRRRSATSLTYALRCRSLHRLWPRGAQDGRLSDGAQTPCSGEGGSPGGSERQFPCHAAPGRIPERQALPT